MADWLRAALRDAPGELRRSLDDCPEPERGEAQVHLAWGFADAVGRSLPGHDTLAGGGPDPLQVAIDAQGLRGARITHH